MFSYPQAHSSGAVRYGNREIAQNFIIPIVTILRDTVTTSWSADDICFLILNISCWSDILVLYVFSSTLPVLACYILIHAFESTSQHIQNAAT